LRYGNQAKRALAAERRAGDTAPKGCQLCSVPGQQVRMWTCITISVSLQQTCSYSSSLHQALTGILQAILPHVLSRSYPSNNHVKEVKQGASYWHNLAAEVSAGRGATGSQLIINSRSSAAELAAERCKTAKAEQLLNRAYAYAEDLKQSVADHESELISSQGALQRSKRAHEQSNTKLASQVSVYFVGCLVLCTWVSFPLTLLFVP